MLLIKKKKISHPWDVSPKAAISIQRDLIRHTMLVDDFQDIKLVAGTDLRILKENKRVFCAIVVLSYPGGKIIEEVQAGSSLRYPYIPGLLTFREGPAVLDCARRLKNKPDLMIFDGQGYSHPRRMGLATHMGILLDIPSIGCAKSRLIGEYEEPGRKKGDYSLLYDKGEVIGTALRTRDDTRPVFISAGHRICLSTSLKIVLELSRTRIPEPTRLAHNHLKGRY